MFGSGPCPGRVYRLMTRPNSFPTTTGRLSPRRRSTGDRPSTDLARPRSRGHVALAHRGPSDASSFAFPPPPRRRSRSPRTATRLERAVERAPPSGDQGLHRALTEAVGMSVPGLDARREAFTEAAGTAASGSRRSASAEGGRQPARPGRGVEQPAAAGRRVQRGQAVPPHLRPGPGAAPGSGRWSQTDSPRLGSVGGSETSARPCPVQPVRRNRRAPGPAGRSARRTSGRPPATTWAKPSGAPRASSNATRSDHKAQAEADAEVRRHGQVACATTPGRAGGGRRGWPPGRPRGAARAPVRASGAARGRG
ncbi:hypothetical protein ABIC27_004826 [Streptomyces sp. PvR034]